MPIGDLLDNPAAHAVLKMHGGAGNVSIETFRRPAETVRTTDVVIMSIEANNI
jgi:hypothetical protein